MFRRHDVHCLPAARTGIVVPPAYNGCHVRDVLSVLSLS